MVRVTCPIRSILISSPLSVLGVTGTNRHWYARRCGVPLIKVKNESGGGGGFPIRVVGGNNSKIARARESEWRPAILCDSLSRDSFGKRAVKIYA